MPLPHLSVVWMLLAAAGSYLAGVNAARAGAWLMPPGEGQVIVYSAFSDSTRAFDAQGHLIPVPAYQKFELGAYVEYGLTDSLTLVASPSFDIIRNPPPGQSYTGPGESELAAKVGLWRTENSIVSLQAGLRSPGGSFADSLAPFAVRRAGSVDIRVMAGKSWTALGMDGFVDAEAGYRIYGGNQPAEWRLDLTLGVRPLPRLLVMLQSFTSVTNGAFPFGQVSWTKLQPSIVFDIAKDWSLQLGGFVTVAGKNSGRELGPAVGLWYRF